MDRQSVNTTLAPDVIIEEVLGSLQVKGWERPEVQVKAPPGQVSLEEVDDVVRLRCRGDCTVRLPHGASLQIERAHGGVQIKLLEDELTIEEVLGGLSLRDVGPTRVEAVHGELDARRVGGNLEVERVLGNASARDVQGALRLPEVKGNLEAREVEAEVQAAAEGNVRLRLSSLSGERYELRAGGNLEARLPEDASLRLDLTSAGRSIQFKVPSEAQVVQEDESRVQITLGDGAAAMELSAGGRLQVVCKEVDWGEAEEAGETFEGGFGNFSPDFHQRFSDQIQGQIDAQVEAMTRQFNERMARIFSMGTQAGLSEEQAEELARQVRETGERAAARAQEKMHRAQERLERKLESARRRQELKAQAAERRGTARHGPHRARGAWSFEWGSHPASPAPEQEPVSDEERLTILRMLEQKKISLEEAENLLAALEGKEE